MAGYFDGINEQICVMVQIESRAGLDGRDATLPRSTASTACSSDPSDLAAGLGHLGNAAHPEVQAAIAIGRSRPRQARHKPIGILAPVEADARRYMRDGLPASSPSAAISAFRGGHAGAAQDRYRRAEHLDRQSPQHDDHDSP